MSGSTAACASWEMQPRSSFIKRAPTSAGRVTASALRTLRSPRLGLLGQGLRFGLAGGTVALVYLATTLALADIVGVPFQAALAIGLGVGLSVHFTLQRTFVWVHHEEFALPMHQQAGRYLAVAGVQYGVTAASTLLLPSVLGVPVEVVYLATVAVVISANFLMFRHRIFHAKVPGSPPARSDRGR